MGLVAFSTAVGETTGFGGRLLTGGGIFGLSKYPPFLRIVYYYMDNIGVILLTYPRYDIYSACS